MKIRKWFREGSWQQNLLELVFLLLLILFIRFYIVQFFRVSGASMCPTLNQYGDDPLYCRQEAGDFIFVNELIYNFIDKPQRGDPIVMVSPNSEPNIFLTYIDKILPFLKIKTELPVSYLKRIIGVPGDTISLRAGKVFLTNDNIKNLELNEPYLSIKNDGKTYIWNSGETATTYEVPEGKYFVMGDNRLHSLDSRRCFGDCKKDSPFVDIKKIKGRVESIIFPLNHIKFIENEFDYSQL